MFIKNGSNKKSVIEIKKETVLTDKQNSIYSGLSNIGEEIASFYFDGVRILNSENLFTKSYLLAHIGREIEGEIRGILAPRKDSKICKVCNQVIPEEGGHIDSICRALNLTSNHPLVKKWYKLEFHKFAHRSGGYKEPRNEEIVLQKWKDFEDILGLLVGNYYNLIIRVLDVILEHEKPSRKVLLEISNLLKKDAYKNYFFNNLKSKFWLKKLRDYGYFSPHNNPTPYELSGREGYKTPYWPELKYLEKIAVENTKEGDKEIEEAIFEIINGIMSYKNKDNKRIDNSRTDFSILKILCTLPTNNINDLHLKFIEEALNTRWGNHLFARTLCEEFIPRLIKDKAKDLILGLLEITLSFIEEKDKLGREYKSIIEEYIFNDFLNKNKEGIADLCGKKASRIGIKKIEEIIKKDKFKFDIHSIWTIKDEEQPRSTDDYNYQIIRFVRDIYEHSNPETIKENISILLNKKHSIFKRIAIHVINHHYKNLNDLFWQGWQDNNPLDDYQLKPEIYELFKSNCTLFYKEQIMIIINWINTEDYKEKTKEAKAYRKREWLETLISTNNPKVLEEYEKNKKINPIPITYPGKVIWMDIRGIRDMSPISTEKLLKMTNEQIAQYLINFKEEEFFDKPTQEGLEDTLRKSITENPSKYTEDLPPFFKLSFSYHRVILQGLNKAWRENKSFHWENVFDYISAIIDVGNDNYRDFWEVEYEKDHYNCRNSIINEVAHLIHEGTKNDDHAFDKMLLPIAERILLLLARNVKSSLNTTGDLHSRIINSVKYDIFSAMISYSLRYVRTNPDLAKEDRWKKEIKDDFTNRLGNETSEFYFTLGQYFLSLYYLNKEWVQKNINKIFYKKDKLLYKSSIIGFFAYTNKVYLEIYNLLKGNNILLDALNYEFSERHINEKVIQYICIGYIEDWEELKDPNSLISKILEDKKEYQIAEVVRFVEMFRENLTEKIRQKIKPLWERIFNIILENEEKSEFQNIAVELIDWLNLVDKIDEDIFNWLKLSVKYINQYNPGWIYRKFYKHIDKNPEKIGKLILEMLKYKVPATYDTEYITKVVEVLYSKNQKEIADKICNIYGENGYYFLKDTFKSHNKA